MTQSARFRPFFMATCWTLFFSPTAIIQRFWVHDYWLSKFLALEACHSVQIRSHYRFTTALTGSNQVPSFDSWTSCLCAHFLQTQSFAYLHRLLLHITWAHRSKIHLNIASCRWQLWRDRSGNRFRWRSLRNWQELSSAKREIWVSPWLRCCEHVFIPVAKQNTLRPEDGCSKGLLMVIF